MKLAAAYRGRLARKEVSQIRRFEGATNKEREEDAAEAARPKPTKIYRPQGKSYSGF
jgi:hypothetical protein